jgi:hypothetical protein
VLSLLRGRHLRGPAGPRVAQAGSVVIARGLAPQGSEDLVGITRPDAARVYGCYGIKSDFELAELEADGAVTGTPVTTRLAK